MVDGSKSLSAGQFLLITLVVKLAIMAVLSTMLVRFRRFRAILITERRDWPDRLLFAMAVGVPLTAGVASRILLRYDAADLTLEGSFLVGLIAGPYAGAIVGAMTGAPALLAGQFIAPILAVGAGFAGGGLREICPKEAIWRFSPFFFTDLHRYAWRIVRSMQVDWAVVLLAVPISLEILRQVLGHRFGEQRLFYLDSSSPVFMVIGVIASVLCVAIPIKIWNSARIEHRLQEQDTLLMQARIEALASQINPHFLFNTLNSISSLIRTQPETARMLIGRLSGLLRRLLRSHEHFVTLREELEAIDEYLAIETVRFGPNLRVDKDIAAETLDIVVPSMILQPLIENSIKHGISPRVGGGRITIRARRENAHAIIEIDDDGLGMSVAKLSSALTDGIGLSNVNERLRVIYGANYQLRLKSTAGQGAVARIEIPEMVAAARRTA